MSGFDFFCFYCGQRLSADTPDVGALTECPVCKNRFNIPAPPRSSPMLPPTKVEPAAKPPSPDSVFEFRCPACTQPLSATVRDAGHDVACPACDTIFAIPKPNTGALAAQLAANSGRGAAIMPAPPRIDSGVNAIPSNLKPAASPASPTTHGNKPATGAGFTVVDDAGRPKKPAATPPTQGVPSKPATVTGKPGTAAKLPTAKELLAGTTPPSPSSSSTAKPNSASNPALKKPASSTPKSITTAGPAQAGPSKPATGGMGPSSTRPPTGKFKAPTKPNDGEVVPVDVEAEPMEAEPATAEAVPVAPPVSADPFGSMDPFTAVDSMFHFDESAPAADTALSELPDWRREFAQREGRRLSSGSVPVLPTGSEMMFALASGKTVEELSDAHATALVLKAARIALEDMAATPDCCALLDPPADAVVPGAPRPQFLAYLRPEPTNTKDAWVFVFLAAHVIAYKVMTREEFVCRSPNLVLDVRFKPGVPEKSKTHLGFRLGKDDRTDVCKVSLTFVPNGPLALSARDFALQIKGWLRAHPVLSRRMEAELMRVTEVRKAAKPASDGGSNGPSGPPYVKGRTQK